MIYNQLYYYLIKIQLPIKIQLSYIYWLKFRLEPLSLIK